MTQFGAIRIGDLPEKLLERAPVGRTLMSGLGGTGKEVLLRFRRLIVERYGSLEALPCIQFMHLDTDSTSQAQQQYDRNMADDPLYKKISFKPFERQNLLIKGGINRYLTNLNAFPNIKEWFNNKGKIAGLGDLGEGAGQVRMASRLGFFHNYNDIESSLDQAKRHLMSDKIKAKVKDIGFNFNPNDMNIYVISSLAGGTGSGIFLDMGFLLKTLFKDSVRMGVLFLPSFFSGYPNDDRMKANGYAALMELNHYSFGNTFYSNWNGHTYKPCLPPPFDYTYLLEGENEANEGIGKSGQEFSIYQMVAEIMFQDFSQGDFSGLKRAIRINLKNFIDNAYVHNLWSTGDAVGIQQNNELITGDSYTTRFCSFGLAALNFPVEKVHRACACRLANTILEHWQKNVVKNPLDVLFTDFLINPEVEFAQGKYTRRDGGGIIDRADIEKELLWYNKQAGKDFKSYYWEKTLNLKNDIEENPFGEKALALEEFRNQIERLLAHEDSEHPEEWGMDIRLINSNMENYIEKVKKGIEEQASRIANDSRYGISYSLSLLQELKKLLKDENFNYSQYFDNMLIEYSNATEEFMYELDQINIDIRRHERQILFKKADIERDIQLLINPESEEDAGILFNYLNARLMKQISKRGKSICEEINIFLGQDSSSGKGLLAKYHQLTSGLDDIKTKIKEKENYFSKSEDFTTIKTLYRENDADEWYNIWTGGNENEKQNLERVSKDLLTKIFKVESVTEALHHIQKSSNEQIEEEMIEQCRQFFASQDRQPSALEMLFDDSRCNENKRDYLINCLYKSSKVWLKQTGDVDQVQFNIKNQQKPCIIGIDTDDSVRFNKFQELIRNMQDSGDLAPQYKNIGNSKKASIISYNELGGATAFYPSSVHGLKQKYDEFCRNPKCLDSDNQEEVHFHKNRFQFSDIIPKTPDEIIKYSYSIRSFVLARILGILNIEEIADEQKIENIYSYRQEISFNMVEHSLGDEFSAVDILYRDPNIEEKSHKKYLHDQIEEIITKLQHHRLLSVYLLLIEFYIENVYQPTTEATEIAGVKKKKLSPFNASLEYERSIRIPEDLLSNKKENQRLKESLVVLRGKPIGKSLTYDEYVKALKKYTKTSGKIRFSKKTVVGESYEYKDALVLDQKRAFSEEEIEEEIDESEVLSQKRVKKSEKDGPEKAKRKCPNCGKYINVRAIKCHHCKKIVAKHITCQHCHETKVPDDLTVCWKCGSEPAEPEKMIECEGCYDYTGNISDSKPCPKCGWHPSQEDDNDQYEEVQEDSVDDDGINDDDFDNDEFDNDEFEEIDDDDFEGDDEDDNLKEESSDNEQYKEKQNQHRQQQDKSKASSKDKESQHKKENFQKNRNNEGTSQKTSERSNKKNLKTSSKKESDTKTNQMTYENKAKAENKAKTEKKDQAKQASAKKKQNKELVECPNCFEMVEKGPLCENCGEYLI